MDRGPWRKFNPYNPWTEDSENKKEPENLKVESLDDLFEESGTENKNEKVEPMTQTISEATGLGAQEPVVQPKPEPEPASLPLETDDDDYDLQKELEAKFDELFGPIDEE